MRVLKQMSTGKIVSWMTGASDGTLTSNERTIAANDLIESDMPTSQLRSEWKTQRDAEETYVDKRKLAYPTIGDQLDMLWHAIDVGDWTAAKVKTTSFYTELKAVKDANPKQEPEQWRLLQSKEISQKMEQ